MTRAAKGANYAGCGTGMILQGEKLEEFSS